MDKGFREAITTTNKMIFDLIYEIINII